MKTLIVSRRILDIRYVEEALLIVVPFWTEGFEMGKKKVVKQKPVEPEAEVKSAADAVRQAREDFKKAQEYYDDAQQRASETMDQVREMTVGDLVDTSFECVRKYPVASVAAAAAAGFYLGRLFRR